MSLSIFDFLLCTFLRTFWVDEKHNSLYFHWGFANFSSINPSLLYIGVVAPWKLFLLKIHISLKLQSSLQINTRYDKFMSTFCFFLSKKGRHCSLKPLSNFILTLFVVETCWATLLNFFTRSDAGRFVKFVICQIRYLSNSLFVNYLSNSLIRYLSTICQIRYLSTICQIR